MARSAIIFRRFFFDKIEKNKWLLRNEEEKKFYWDNRAFFYWYKMGWVHSEYREDGKPGGGKRNQYIRFRTLEERQKLGGKMQ